MVQTVAVWGVTALTATLLAGLLAGLKNRDYSSWMGWSFLCPPLVLLLAVLPKLEGRRPRRRALDDEDAAEA